MLKEYNIIERTDIIDEIFSNVNIELLLKKQLLEMLSELGYKLNIIIKFKNGCKKIKPKDFIFKNNNKSFEIISNILHNEHLELEVSKDMINWIEFNKWITSNQLEDYEYALAIMTAKQTSNDELLNKLVTDNNVKFIENKIKSIEELLKI